MCRYLLGMLLLHCVPGLAVSGVAAEPLPWIEVSADGRGFVEAGTGKAFLPWGVNYDHDTDGRLIEDYWETEWDAIVGDFQEMRELGANAVRIHLQLGKFMQTAEQPDPAALRQLQRLVGLAEQQRLYLNLTGLGCYHRKDVPAWYDALDETARWETQANFWKAVAGAVKDSPAVFCLDLMNEPVVPGGQRKAGDWLGPPFVDKHFVQMITLDQADRLRPKIAARWIHTLVTAIRAADRRHLITVGLVDWSLGRPGLTSGFVPDQIATDLDFLCVHLYPEKGRLEDSLATLKGFQVGKPVVVEEMFPLKCSAQELDDFVVRSRPVAAGWFSFYWGRELDSLQSSSSLGDALLAQWLEFFRRRARQL